MDLFGGFLERKVGGASEAQTDSWLRSIFSFFGLDKLVSDVTDFFGGSKNVFSMLIASIFGGSQPPPSTVLDTGAGAGADGAHPTKSGGTDTAPKAGSQTNLDTSAASGVEDLKNLFTSKSAEVATALDSDNNLADREAVIQELSIQFADTVGDDFIITDAEKSLFAQSFADSHDGVKKAEVEAAIATLTSVIPKLNK